MKKNILKIITAFKLSGFCLLAFGGSPERDLYTALGPDPLWAINFNLQKDVSVLDYRYFWIGGPDLLGLEIPVPLPVRKAGDYDKLSGVSLGGKLPSGPFYVEWINYSGHKYIYLIPVKELVEKNGLNSKRLLTLKFSLEAGDSFIITAKDLSHKEPITLFSNKEINTNVSDTTEGRWHSIPLITFNYEVPSGFNTSTIYLEDIPEANSFRHNNGYTYKRGTNPLTTPIRSGMFTMRDLNDIKDTVLIEWTDPKTSQLISYRFNLKEKLKELGLTDTNRENSIYSFKKEILFRINKDNSLDVLFVTKELYANSENKNQENPILILSCNINKKCE